MSKIEYAGGGELRPYYELAERSAMSLDEVIEHAARGNLRPVLDRITDIRNATIAPARPKCSRAQLEAREIRWGLNQPDTTPKHLHVPALS